MNQDVTTWLVSRLNTPAFAQITFSSVKHCLLLSGVHCFCALWSETCLHSFNVVVLVFYCKYIFVLFVHVEVVLYFYYWHFLSSWKQDIIKFVIHIVKKCLEYKRI